MLYTICIATGPIRDWLYGKGEAFTGKIPFEIENDFLVLCGVAQKARIRSQRILACELLVRYSLERSEPASLPAMEKGGKCCLGLEICQTAKKSQAVYQSAPLTSRWVVLGRAPRPRSTNHSCGCNLFHSSLDSVRNAPSVHL